MLEFLLKDDFSLFFEFELPLELYNDPEPSSSFDELLETFDYVFELENTVSFFNTSISTFSTELSKDAVAVSSL